MVVILAGVLNLDIWVSSHNGNLQDKVVSQEIWDLISPPGTNLSHKVYIYRFFFECSRDIVDSFQQVKLPDNSAGAKQQATRELQSQFTNILCKLQEFRAIFRISQARIDAFGRGFPDAAKLILLNHAQNELYENSRWQLVPQFKTNFPIQTAEGSSFRMLANPNDVTLPGAVIESLENLRGNFRTARSVSEFDVRRKGQLFHILIGHRNFTNPTE